MAVIVSVLYWQTNLCSKQANKCVYIFFIGLTDKHSKVVEKYKCK